VLNLPTGQNSVFSPQGRLVAAIQVKFGTADGHLGPLGCAMQHFNSVGEWGGTGNAAPKYQKFHFLDFGKESPCRGEPLTDF